MLEVVNNPLSVLAVQDRAPEGAESLADALAGVDVGELDCALGSRGSSDIDLNNVAGLDSKVAKIIGVVGVPLTPGIVGDSAEAGHSDIGTGLKKTAGAGVTVDADPDRG